MSGRAVTDFGVGGTAVTVPLWLQHLEVWAQAFVLVGGAVLLVLRIAGALRDLRKKEADDGARGDRR